MPHDERLWLLLVPAVAVADRLTTGIAVGAAILVVLLCRHGLGRLAATSAGAWLAVATATTAVLAGADLALAAWLPASGIPAGAVFVAVVCLLDVQAANRAPVASRLLASSLPALTGATRELIATGTLGSAPSGATGHPVVGLLLLTLAAALVGFLGHARKPRP